MYMVKHFEISVLAAFKYAVENCATVVTRLLYITSPELTHLITESLHPLTSPINPTPKPLPITNLFSVSMSSASLDYTYKSDCTLFSILSHREVFEFYIIVVLVFMLCAWLLCLHLGL